MADVLGAYLLDYLKLLTPREISRLTSDIVALKEMAEQEKEISPVAKTNVQSQLAQEQMSNSHTTQSNEEQEQADAEEYLNQYAQKKVVGQDFEHFEEPVEDQQELSDQVRAGPNLKVVSGGKGGDLSALGIASNAELDAQAKEEEKRRRDSTPSTSMFILDQKEKLKKCQQTLKGKDAVKNYRETQQDPGIVDKDDLSKSNKSGILLDKKQY